MCFYFIFGKDAEEKGIYSFWWLVISMSDHNDSVKGCVGGFNFKVLKPLSAALL